MLNAYISILHWICLTGDWDDVECEPGWFSYENIETGFPKCCRFNPMKTIKEDELDIASPHDDNCPLNATGDKESARKKIERLLVKNRDIEQWVRKLTVMHLF
jgi:hypothetical protein